MRDTPNRVAIDRVDWLSVLPVLRLGSAFRHALQPGKLVVALLAILLIHGFGLLLDKANEDKPEPDPVEVLLESGESAVVAVNYSSDAGPYESLLGMEREGFRLLIRSAASLDHGFGPGETGAADALYMMAISTPLSLYQDYPGSTIAFGAFALIVFMLAAGVICRMAATQVCLDKNTSVRKARRYVTKRWAWYLVGPLLPTALVLLVGCVLMLCGLAFFNLPVTDVIGAVLYGLLLLGGFVIVLVLMATLFAGLMMPAAMSVEGTDGFDVIARTFNYVLYKPWQFAAYLFSALVYLAAVFALVSALAGLTAFATESFVDVGAVSEIDLGSDTPEDVEQPPISRYEAVVRGDEIAEETSDGTIIISAWIIERWHELLSGLVGAVVFSTLCCLMTQVYVLMRRCADGAPLDACAMEDEADPWSSPKDMVDPEAQKIAETGPTGQPAPEADSDSPGDSQSQAADDTPDETADDAKPEG